MRTWNEENFLERLAPLLRQKPYAGRNTCPDVDTLVAVLEGAAPTEVNETVTRHLAECPECVDLYGRLLNFQIGSPPEPEAAWKETRKRLDIWLEGFLRSQAATLRPTRPLKLSGRFPLWESISRPLTLRKVQWALGASIALILITSGVVLEKLRHEQVPENQTALRGTVAPHPQTEATHGVPPPPASALPSRERVPLEAKGPAGEKAGGEPPAAPILVSPTVTLRNPTTDTAENRPALPPSPGLGANGQGSNTSSETPSGGSNTESASPKAAQRLPSAPVPFLRLEPSAHLVMVVSSIRWLQEGSFQIQGTLLVGVPQAGSVRLDQGAQVIGTGVMNHGQPSIAVTEFVVQGTRYALNAGNGAMRTQTPGTGGAVQFDRSQVLEMWPKSPAVYQKKPDANRPPESPR
jgi:hypothetical protein